MATQQTTRQIKITLPDELYQKLNQEAERRSQDLSSVIQVALEFFIQQFDLTQTQTWELCGAFSIGEIDPEYQVGKDEAGKPITNYAEHDDHIRQMAGVGIRCNPDIQSLNA